MHTVTLTDEKDTYLFASLDGEHYVGVTRLPQPGEEDQIQRILDGDGKFKPMTIAPRLFRLYESRGDKVVWGTV